MFDHLIGNVDLPAGQTSPLQFEQNAVSSELAASQVGQRPGSLLDLGRANRVGDSRLRDPAGGDFSLRPGSVALELASLRKLGAEVAAQAWIEGEPATLTADRQATLTVGGPGMFAFKYRVNGGAWSEEQPIGQGFSPQGTQRTATITLSGLPNGQHTVEVLGRDFAGRWQSEPTVPRSWTIQTATPALVINEVLASNRYPR